MKKALLFIKHELMEMLPSTIFFFIIFQIIVFTRMLKGDQSNVSLGSVLAATIGALIVGKSILIAEALPIFNWLKSKRLIYDIIFRLFIYELIVLLFQFLEELIPLISKYDSFPKAMSHLFEEIDWAMFWSTHIVLALFLIIYCLASGVIGVIGRDKVLKILLSPKST
jgi:hypothetical protein